MARTLLAGVATLAAASLLLVGCGSTAGTGSSDSGNITFLTNRTDLEADGTYDAYIAEFQKTYPDINVTVEAITNYADDVRTRMASPNGYGDVLLIPQVNAEEFQYYFEPLGQTDEMSGTYRFLSTATYEGVQYGVALGGNANGVIYNTEVFADAGITELPTTPEEFLADLQLIKDNTDATPYYTNYKDGWPIGGQWSSNIGAITGNDEAQNEMAHDATPWTDGTDIYTIDSLLYDIVAEGLSEEDPLTTNWEQSKTDLVQGKIGTMVLGSWAISQLEATTEEAGVDPSVIGFMAFPATAGGTQYATIGGDYNLAINVNSANKEAAQAWIDFLIEDSGFTESQGMISSLKDADLPDNLSSLSDNNVELLELASPPEGEDGLFNSIADASQVDIWGNLYRQKLVDIARGQADGDKDSYFAQLNQQWGDAVAELG